MEKNEILDTSVAIRRKEGIITILNVLEYANSLKKLFTVLLPDSQDYAKAIEISQSLLQQGTPIGAMDMLIAAMAMNRKTTLITKDKDFRQIQKAFSAFSVEFL